jgi:hypothetical protein
MRYDDILHRSFLAAIHGILSNPTNKDVSISSVVEQAWNVGIMAANRAKNGSSLISMVFTTVASTTAIADPGVSTSGVDGSINKPTTSNTTTNNPTNVITPSGEYVDRS